MLIKALPFILLGYGLSLVGGIVLTAWLGDAPYAALSGLLLAWIGGGVGTLIVAFGWTRGFWLTGYRAQPAPVSPPVDETEFTQWERDLAAEVFANDVARDASAESGAGAKKTG